MNITITIDEAREYEGRVKEWIFERDRVIEIHFHKNMCYVNSPANPWDEGYEKTRAVLMQRAIQALEIHDKQKPFPKIIPQV